MFILLQLLYEHAIHPNKGSHTYVCSTLQSLYEHAIHPNKGSHTYVCSPYNCCMNMQYIQIKEAIHMFVLLTIAV